MYSQFAFYIVFLLYYIAFFSVRLFRSLIKRTMDWIHDTQRLLSIHETSCLREELPYISLVFMYVDKNKEVSAVVKDRMEFQNTPRLLSKDKIMELVQKNHKVNYTLKDTLLFHIPIEPELVPSFHEDAFKKYWTSYPVLRDIPLARSIFIFHPYNTLYFIFHELKSSLKIGSIGKLTKRVRWGKNKHHTRKQGE